jgi:hypothetical protein
MCGARSDRGSTIGVGVACLLGNKAWLALPGQVREKLASDPLARGLHAYFASNKQIFATWPDILKWLMGRESMQNSKCLHALEGALAKVHAATGRGG